MLFGEVNHRNGRHPAITYPDEGSVCRGKANPRYPQGQYHFSAASYRTAYTMSLFLSRPVIYAASETAATSGCQVQRLTSCTAALTSNRRESESLVPHIVRVVGDGGVLSLTPA